MRRVELPRCCGIEQKCGWSRGAVMEANMYSALAGSFFLLGIGMLMVCAMDGFAFRGKTARSAVPNPKAEAARRAGSGR